MKSYPSYFSFSSWKLIFLGLCYIIKSIDSHILVYQSITNQLLEEFDDWPALFGPTIPSNGLKLYPVVAVPINYCFGNLTPAHTKKDVLIIERGPENCSFEVKVRNAQRNNYKAVIVYNNEGNELEQMSAKNSTGIDIPAVFVGKTAGFRLRAYVSSSQDTYFVINDELPFNINTQLILPFSILIGLCFLIMIFYMIYKCVREERRLRQYRLPKSMLKKIPIIKFTKTNDLSYDTCVICLEEFIEGDKLRVLPCKHPYHSHCIDPWLTKNRRVCPVCKRKVFGKDEERRNPNRQSSMDSADTDDDSTPLLRPDDNNSSTNNHGTFSRNSATQSNNPSADVVVLAANNDDHDDDDDEGNQMSDEENVLLTHPSQQRNNTGARRINPFDRAPNLPPNLANQFTNNGTESFWSYPILRLFKRRNPPISVTAQPIRTSSARGGFAGSLRTTAAGGSGSGSMNNVEAQAAISPSQQPSSMIISAAPSANNILNPNLSGSFKDDDDDDDDMATAPHQSIYEPISRVTPSTVAQRRIDQTTLTAAATVTATDTDSVFIQTPSHGGIGVVALPNAESINNVANPSATTNRTSDSILWNQFYV